MTQFTKLFVVFDPTREDQPALERAADIARDSAADLHVYCCIYQALDGAAEKSAEVKRLLKAQQDILDCAVADLNLAKVKVSTQVAWDKNWYQAVVRASINNCADLVMKSSYKHSAGKRILSRTSDKTLIRECLCPVLLVKEGGGQDVRRVLAAIDVRAKNEAYDRLNQNVIDLGKRLREKPRTEVHFINAFEDFNGVPDRRELMENCDAQSDRIHIKLGKPKDVIVQQAKRLDANLVVMGNSARTGISAALMGNTVEKVLDKLECDVLSMP